jgi:Lon protease-like protein
MIGDCLAEDKEFGIAYFGAGGIQAAGCTARINKVLERYDDGRLDILARGQIRFWIKEIFDQKAYLEARVAYFDDEALEDEKTCRRLAETGLALLRQSSETPAKEPEFSSLEDMDVKSVSFEITGYEGFSGEEKQRFLEMTSTLERLEKSVASLKKIIERMKLTADVQKIIGGNGNLKKAPAGRHLF